MKKHIFWRSRIQDMMCSRTATRVEGWHFGGSYLSAALWKAPGAIELVSKPIPIHGQAFREYLELRSLIYSPLRPLYVECVWKSPCTAVKIPPIIIVPLELESIAMAGTRGERRGVQPRRNFSSMYKDKESARMFASEHCCRHVVLVRICKHWTNFILFYFILFYFYFFLNLWINVQEVH